MEQTIRRVMKNYVQEMSFLDAEDEVSETELHENKDSVVVLFKFKEETHVETVKSTLKAEIGEKFDVLTYQGSKTEEDNEIKLLITER